MRQGYVGGLTTSLALLCPHFVCAVAFLPVRASTAQELSTSSRNLMLSHLTSQIAASDGTLRSSPVPSAAFCWDSNLLGFKMQAAAASASNAQLDCRSNHLF
jgi:hypothetical protein